MPIPIACPGCGLTEKGPDALIGKKVRCKRCKQAFVVGGEPAGKAPAAAPKAAAVKPAAPKPAPAKPAAVKAGATKPAAPKPQARKPVAKKPESDADLDFGEPEIGGHRRGSNSALAPIMMVLLGLLLGGGGAAGYLYLNKPKPAEAGGEEAKAAPEESKFTWIAK